MIVTKKALSRRAVLRGIGAAVALPLLDSMVPAFAAIRNTAAKPIRRLGVFYSPNGMAMPHWTPKGVGGPLELTPILEPMAAFRNRMVVVSGLTNKTPVPANDHHSNASTRFLTGVEPKQSSNSDLEAGVSMDQLAAQYIGEGTQFTSLELNLDSRNFAGTCVPGYSCAYTNTISWRTDTTPLPMENNPRVVFERLFGDSGTDPTARLARLQEDRSVLDSVMGEVADLTRQLGPDDGMKLSQYLDSVRDVERRIQSAEKQGLADLSGVDRPSGVPDTFQEHARLMFDLQLLAYRADLTRVISFMWGIEISGRPYPEIGLPDPHHSISHHKDDPSLIAKLAKINAYHTTLFAEYLQKLQSAPDGDGTLFDHTLMLYGAGMSNSNIHWSDDLPLLLVGGGADQFKGGCHLVFSRDTPISNLHLTVLDKLGAPVEKFGCSTGKLDTLLI